MFLFLRAYTRRASRFRDLRLTGGCQNPDPPALERLFTGGAGAIFCGDIVRVSGAGGRAAGHRGRRRSSNRPQVQLANVFATAVDRRGGTDPYRVSLRQADVEQAASQLLVQPDDRRQAGLLHSPVYQSVA